MMPNSLYAFIWKVSRKQQIWLVVLTLLVAGLTMLPLELQRRMVDDAINHADLRFLGLLATAYLGVILLQGGLKYLLNVYRGRLVERVVRKLRQTLFINLVANHETRNKATPDKGAVVSMSSAEVEEVAGFVGDAFSFPLMQGGTALATLGYLFWIEPKIAVFAFVLYLPQLLIVPMGQKRINRWAAIHARLARKMGSVIVHAEDGTLTPHRLESRFSRLSEGAFQTRVRIYRVKFFLTFFGNFIDAFGPLTVLSIGGWLVMHGQAEISTLVVFISGFQKVADPWDQLLTFYRTTSNARTKYRLLAEAMPDRRA
jgi:ABC-type multidrug transport system fused ATPase/permease subunit